MPWGVYFCFTGWTKVEQIETGDTLLHTFHIYDWPICESRNFLFAGEITGIESPSMSPIFNHHNSGWPPLEYIIRPSSPGDTCSIPQEIGAPCPNHYINVQEPVPDEDISCVFNRQSATTGYLPDLYRAALLPPTDNPIYAVTLTARLRRLGGYSYVSLAQWLIKASGEYWWGPTINEIPTSYKNFNLSLPNNPVTKNPWTRPEINTLQIGIGLRTYWGVGWASNSYCTQIYATIYFHFRLH